MAHTELSQAEREELEALRAEKAAREAKAAQEKEREELETLRAEQARAEKEAAQAAHEAEVIERNRKFMEPDEDLKMPLGQKIVLLALAAIVIISVIYVVLGV